MSTTPDDDGSLGRQTEPLLPPPEQSKKIDEEMASGTERSGVTAGEAEEEEEEERQRIVDFGHPERDAPFADNSVKTSRYTFLSFLPLALSEQFRKVGNVYFLCMGGIMYIGAYTPAFDTSVTPWSTLTPLALVVVVSLMQEGYRDVERHHSDYKTNSKPCVVLRRAEPEGFKPEKSKRMDRDPRLNGGNDLPVRIAGSGEVNIAFESVPRKGICAGDFVVVRNREMVPADLILLATSNEGGNAYIETSSIDGETNLKLRNSPHLPVRLPRSSSLFNSARLDGGDSGLSHAEAESFRHAVQRIAGMSLLGHPDGVCALMNPANADENLALPITKRPRKGLFQKLFGKEEQFSITHRRIPEGGEVVTYVASLTSEPPNTHVNNYTGMLTLPPNRPRDRSEHAPLNAENILLRGAVLRNTDWAIGLACFTGADTKLVMNSVATPAKFSQLDGLVNRTVFQVLGIMLLCVCSLGALSVRQNAAAFDELWYTGFNTNLDEDWPYFNLEGTSSVPSPAWRTSAPNFLQNTFMFVTLLSNFIPLSAYMAIEIVTVMMILFISWDLRMYHAESDTPAAARSTIVTDLGLVEYIFSDKTGTLTSNIMEFKRCSVDGHTFGMPLAKAAPGSSGSDAESQPNDNDSSPFSDTIHPLRHLLAGSAPASGLSKEEGSAEPNKLTFNAEMFLRVMSICHTVVVEKDETSEDSEQEEKASWFKKVKDSGKSLSKSSSTNASKKSAPKKKKNEDGAPEGHVYQAESPDEGALVAAASLEYGFQVTGRNSSGVQLSCSCPSLLEDEEVAKGLKSGSITAGSLAARTAPEIGAASSRYSGPEVKTADEDASPRLERWPILAINKFDSDRKRMSVLVRSPPELGGVCMLLCKGADSSMLSEGVCEGAHVLEKLEEVLEEDEEQPNALETIGEEAEEAETGSGADDSEHESLLSMQAHLGEFASEGLRTLVLGVKVLSEEDAEEWLSKFKEASTSIENRDEKLTSVAYEVEKGLHIVGATAIEDRLQDGVPETIANLGNAGIKLWVLTGDKRETAIEIGYSTKVLKPKMHLTQVKDGPPRNVKALVAMELMRHIKIGNLPDYTLSALEEKEGSFLKSMLNCLTLLGNWWSKTRLGWKLFYLTKIKRRFRSKDKCQDELDELEEKIEEQKRRADPIVQRRKVRALAEDIIDDFENDPKNSEVEELRDSVEEYSPSVVFKRALLATESLRIMSSSATLEDPEDSTPGDNTRRLSDSDKVKNLATAPVTFSTQALFRKSALPRTSVLPGQQASKFNERKVTTLERLFAVDDDVRHGKLARHLDDQHKARLSLDKERPGEEGAEPMAGAGVFDVTSVKRGLIVEGAALKHLLGDPVLEEMLFAVASCSESVIACRVSPIQKALLLKMVRKYVMPTPTTLAIGDGANDVGMIQEAHVGIGVSGLEGQQAVNASDFAIAQFRYLESLLLIHGRWNFMRMSKLILYFFYKNAALAITLIIYSKRNLHSGMLLYDAWVMSMFNFVGGSMPAAMMAVFDRDVPREYVLRNPQLYASGPKNEFLSLRMTLRWLAITVIHALLIYFISEPVLALGGGSTSAFKGLMGNWGRDAPGDGEGGDIQVYGTTIYTQLIYVIAIKALFETRSLIYGEFPTFTCTRGKGEGWGSRMGYTWVGVVWFCFIFYFFFLYIYQMIGWLGPQTGSFFPFVGLTSHLMNMRSITWMVSILVPTIATILDVSGKVFGNMYFPTQGQIHAEIAKKEH
eukprot:CAMPEP_0172579250 /NCGR_PEP_ID=MMETSP1067-20121228/139149_1 /TAXON_ID=265564 ORGANISM="Thalassiosira punctigera, Strain Tpunct2005C2" /NCGR_SAMPLE_ID=MMETSP1067 /ASSEMBLY_ACC=CAM_ASM_000444 /LENGTH=1732 /DNA_ID=CAMNT_0013371961 /DNA_START=42 /DNA_END=5240 /DNA_ORIENTATION=-